jgi:hypothetical protein
MRISSLSAMAGLAILFALGCSGGPDGSDAGTDAGTIDSGEDAGLDAGAADGGCSPSGQRVSQGDDCNFCECQPDGTIACTDRECPPFPGCTYDGVDHAYAERFPSTDGCNECVCAASGLACTRRDCPGALEEGAILAESLDEPCGDDATFTARSVIEGLPFDDITMPFLYEHEGPLYPETLPDTTVRLRIVYDGGFAACRIPMAGQEAWDIEAVIELITADGAFDEAFHAYLRKNASGFVISWFVVGSAPAGGLNGTYDPACLDPNGFSFDAQLLEDQSVSGSVFKNCETDIGLTVATFAHTP